MKSSLCARSNHVFGFHHTHPSPFISDHLSKHHHPRRHRHNHPMLHRLWAYITGHAPSTTSPTHPPSSTPPSAPFHLIVLVSGLFGSRANWTAYSEVLSTHLDPTSTYIYTSTSNEYFSTYQGIDTCGARLANEVATVASNLPSLHRISFICHSMGGLISRHAIGLLYDPQKSAIAGLSPAHYVSLATPHVGCHADEGPAQVPLVTWMRALVGERPLPFGLHEAPSRLAAPVAFTIFQKTGRQFFLLDTDGGRPPLLYRLSQDGTRSSSRSGDAGKARVEEEKEVLFLSALASFETRTCYANRSGDHLVGWANSSIRHVHELPAFEDCNSSSSSTTASAGGGGGVMMRHHLAQGSPTDADIDSSPRQSLQGSQGGFYIFSVGVLLCCAFFFFFF